MAQSKQKTSSTRRDGRAIYARCRSAEYARYMRRGRQRGFRKIAQYVRYLLDKDQQEEENAPLARAS